MSASNPNSDVFDHGEGCWGHVFVERLWKRIVSNRCAWKSKPAMSRRALFKFRLYVAGDAQNSAQALANLSALCRVHLPDRHEIEVVDVFPEPKRALADDIFMTPTLVKLVPSPVRRIVGMLSQTQTVLRALGLETLAV